MKLFYNTNGFAHHRLEDVVDLLAEIGYDGIAVTPDVAHLDWRATDGEALRRFSQRCRDARLEVTIESGGRFVLDPKRKHEPNLCSPSGHDRRVEYYLRLVEYARDLEARALSLWSGAAPEGFEPTMELLAGRLEPVLERARASSVVIALEPEPGMFIETIEQYRRLAALTGPDLRLTIDVGHLLATESAPYAAHLTAARDRLAVVHLDDAKVGEHEHRMIGEGDAPWGAFSTALREIGFEGPAIVELSRHSHDAVRAARTAFRRLRDLGF